MNANSLLNKAAGSVTDLGKKAVSSLTNQSYSQGDLSKILANGVNKEKANALFAKDISKSETSVKQTLKSLGVSSVPQNVFDGLVSFHNQVGDITYAYVKGEKIDLTNLYKASEWDRAAGFIAADERDRTRRMKESSMIYSNNYGNPIDDDQLVAKGTEKAKSNMMKGILNQQTGDAATSQQMAALGKAYFDQTKKALPNTDFSTLKQVTDGKLGSLLSKKAGPLPY